MEQLLTQENKTKLFKHSIILLIIGIAVGFLSTQFGGASAGEYDATLINSGDTAWILFATALVMLMTPAVGFFYGGMVSAKNVISVLKQSLVILALVSIQWVLIGYSLAFGEDVNGVVGGMNFFGLQGVGFAPNPDYAATIPHLAFMMFQGMFAIITPVLIIGAFVERIRFKTLVVFTLLWTTLIYDPIAHWVWAPLGWLRSLGALDFAGGTVVHMSAGFSALAAALLIGKRLVKSSPASNANNIPFVILGAALLWFGWFGFNAGSALAAGTLAVTAFVVTNTAAAAAALTWIALSWAENRKPSALAGAVGAVCGLVAITPAAGYVGPISAIAIGILSGVVTYVAVYIRTKKTTIDDTLDVWAVHGIGGLIGAVLTGIFAEKAINAAGNDGLLFGNPELLVTQVIAVAVTAAYAFFGTYILLKILPILGFPLRVSPESEEEGLDQSVHGEVGYRF